MNLVNARPLTLSYILAPFLFHASTKFAYISFSFLYPVSFLLLLLLFGTIFGKDVQPTASDIFIYL